MNSDAYINAIPWEVIEPNKWAIEIPQLLRIMISAPEPKSERNTIERLRNHIAHQSGLYGTTLATIPVLFQLLDSREVSDKGWILELLYVIRFQNPTATLLHAQVYEAMLQGRENLKPFLSHPNRTNRWFSAYILSRFILDGEEPANWLLSQLEVESDEDVKITLVYCLGKLLDAAYYVNRITVNQVLSKLNRLMAADNIPLRYHSLIACIKISGDKTDETTLHQLIEAVKGFDIIEDNDNQLTLPNLPYTLSSVLAGFKEPLRLQLMTQALSVTSSPNLASSLILQMMRIYRFQKVIYNTPCLTELTPNQQQVIEAILNANVFWQNGRNTSISHSFLIDLSSRDHLRKQLAASKLIPE